MQNCIHCSIYKNMHFLPFCRPLLITFFPQRHIWSNLALVISITQFFLLRILTATAGLTPATACTRVATAATRACTAATRAGSTRGPTWCTPTATTQTERPLILPARNTDNLMFFKFYS